MCTVTYIPTRNGVMLSSNRDESPLRTKALLPMIFKTTIGNAIYPVDGSGLGTWIGVQESGNLVILLNGAKTAHVRMPPYAKSRGLIVRELINSRDPLQYWVYINLENLEPFTLVLLQQHELFELCWDGKEKSVENKNAAAPHIWSSSTLYNNHAKAQRQQWFKDWIKKNNSPDLKAIYQMLQEHDNIQNGFVMNRDNIVRTLSISLVEIAGSRINFKYFDLITSTMALLTLDLKINHDKVSLLA